MKTKTFRRLTILIIYLIPLLIGAFMVTLKVFPKATFTLDTTNLDKSTIYLISDNSFALVPFNHLSGSLLEFSQIKINLPISLASTPFQATIRKGYPAAFYPESSTPQDLTCSIKKYKNNFYLIQDSQKFLIPTLNILQSYTLSTDFPDMNQAEFEALPLAKELAGFQEGTLIKNKDRVFVISDSKKIAISSPETMEALNYDWDNIQEASDAEERIHSNGSIPLAAHSIHPDGTLLKDRATQEIYLVSKGERIKIQDPQILKQCYAGVAPIEVNAQNLDTRTCVAHNGVCRTNPDASFKSQPGNGYYFETSLPLNTASLTRLKVVFTRSFSLENLKPIIKSLFP